MNDQQFERLLNEEEGTSLDFKQAQYVLGTDVEKSELVKDILAFANSFRKVEAYILIGVKEVKGGRSQVLGISQHLNDNDIQQLVNSKTQRPIDFAYEAFVFQGVAVGIIRIPRQERPFYLKAKFGKLEKEVVYIRRGSSTDVADLDEVARMGAADRAALDEEQPDLEVQLCDPVQHTALGMKQQFDTEALQLPTKDEIPDYGSGGLMMDFSKNRDFYRDVAKYSRANAILKPLAFEVTNRASVADTGLIALLKDRRPPRPERLGGVLARLNLRSPFVPEHVRLERHGDTTIVTTYLGKIQPQSPMWSPEPFYIGAPASQKVSLQTEVRADNLRKPLQTNLEIDFRVTDRAVTLEQLFELADKYH